mgnify:CR=1 FL=1
MVRLSGKSAATRISLNGVAEWLHNVISSKVFLVVGFLWFFFQSSVIALTTRFGLPPDETYHYDFIKLFTDSGWLPFLSSQDGHYVLGEAVKTPFFIYHYLFSLPNHFLGDGDFAIIFLRMLNVILGLGSLYLLYKIAKFVKLSDFAANLVIFLSASTLMFVFISGSISYDNLFILVTLFAILTLLKILKKPRLPELLYLATALLVGLLIKKNFIVVAALILGIVLIKLLRDKNFLSAVKTVNLATIKSRPSYLVLSFFILILSIVFVQRYVVNTIKYGNFEPKCTAVLAVEKCRENHVFARDEMLDNMQRPPAEKKRYQYISDWSILMSERTYGVFAHTSFAPRANILFLIQTLLILGFAAIIRGLNLKNKNLNLILLISFIYIGALMLENYMRYERYGSFTFAIQGRYALPFVLLIYIAMAYYACQVIRRKQIVYLVASLAIIVFFLSSLPSYIQLTNKDWRNQPTNNARSSLVKFLGQD